MLAAVGAALVAMVCNLTIGKPKYAEHEEVMRSVLAGATELRERAARLAEADTVAFGAVADAYKLARETDEDKAVRVQAIQAALAGAADVPLRTGQAAAEVIGLADRILAGANINVLSDVAVAAASARAALDAAVINVEINISAMKDQDSRSALRAELDKLASAGPLADLVVAAVRGRISSPAGG